MTTQAIQDKLVQIRPTYDAIAKIRKDWENLQTVEQALAAHDSEIASETTELERLKEQEQNLIEMKTEQTKGPAKEPMGFGDTTAFTDALKRTSQDSNKYRAESEAPGDTSSLPDNTPMRERLKKMVGQLQYFWELNNQIVGHINRIADDSSRPLGEALAMLDWRLYNGEIFPGESDDAHLHRLDQWEGELMRCLQFLQSEINALRIRHRNVLPIWEHWRERENKPKHWDEFIADKRAALIEEHNTLRARIAQLQAEIAALPEGGAS